MANKEYVGLDITFNTVTKKKKSCRLFRASINGIKNSCLNTTNYILYFLFTSFEFSFDTTNSNIVDIIRGSGGKDESVATKFDEVIL